MIVRHIPWAQLEQKIREVHLLQSRNGACIFPYANATIELAEVAYDEVRPTSLYVLKSNLAFQEQLAKTLEAQGVDPLKLSGQVMLKSDEGPAVGLIPPIVEETEADGQYILDGMHRTYLGWKSGRKTFVAIRIRNVDAGYPAAAYPNEWSEIVEYDSVPEDITKKRRYRISDYLSLRRDFSALNGSTPRQP